MKIKIKLLLVAALLSFTKTLCFAQVVGTPYIPAEQLVTVSFFYTGSIQTWTVPAGVGEIYVDVIGAQGTNVSATKLGGKGGRTKCKMTVTPGDILYITVGGQSTNNTALYGFGGNGGVSSFGTKSGAGGGLSAISTASPVTHANALVVAAGGGGASFGYLPDAGGGNGGGASGANGIGGFAASAVAGKGGTPSAGGVEGVPIANDLPYQTTAATAGAALTGGNGGSTTGFSSGWSGGGGGGAGYFGGGGGAGGGAAQGGGGGGSSWIKPTYLGAGSLNVSGFNSGHGKIFISYRR